MPIDAEILKVLAKLRPRDFEKPNTKLQALRKLELEISKIPTDQGLPQNLQSELLRQAREILKSDGTTLDQLKNDYTDLKERLSTDLRDLKNQDPSSEQKSSLLNRIRLDQLLKKATEETLQTQLRTPLNQSSATPNAKLFVEVKIELGTPLEKILSIYEERIKSPKNKFFNETILKAARTMRLSQLRTELEKATNQQTATDQPTPEMLKLAHEFVKISMDQGKILEELLEKNQKKLSNLLNTSESQAERLYLETMKTALSEALQERAKTQEATKQEMKATLKLFKDIQIAEQEKGNANIPEILKTKIAQETEAFIDYDAQISNLEYLKTLKQFSSPDAKNYLDQKIAEVKAQSKADPDNYTSRTTKNLDFILGHDNKPTRDTIQNMLTNGYFKEAFRQSQESLIAEIPKITANSTEPFMTKFESLENILKNNTGNIDIEKKVSMSLNLMIEEVGKEARNKLVLEYITRSPYLKDLPSVQESVNIALEKFNKH